MRLINASTLQLEEFYTDIPQYTILSHTWDSPIDEVSYQDMTSGNLEFQSKPGFRKIEGCALQTLSDDYQYCWVDTCCIDKSSSAELSEAINSMFAWYRDSEACYIYLSDVSASDSSPEDALKSARWFRRGWTLQELIAPGMRLFFDNEWTSIGFLEGTRVQGISRLSGFEWVGEDYQSSTERPQHRSSFDIMMLVSEITSIPIKVLETGNCQHWSIAQKMSWAASRTTTRVEDEAYCLLGIFNVNMPLLYGEGDKAFIRFQEEIIKHTSDQTIFAWTNPETDDSEFHGLLARSPQYFAEGRYITPRPGETPFSMTNMGLHIRLPLFQVGRALETDYYIAELAAFYERNNDQGNPKSHKIALHLRRIGLGTQFCRADAGNLALHEGVGGISDRSKLSDIYVRHSIENVAVRETRIKGKGIILTNMNESFGVKVHSLDCNVGVDGVNFVIPFQDHAMIHARIILQTPSESFFAWSVTERKNGIRCALAVVETPEEIDDDDLEWTDKLILSPGEIAEGAGKEGYPPSPTEQLRQVHVREVRSIVRQRVVDSYLFQEVYLDGRT